MAKRTKIEITEGITLQGLVDELVRLQRTRAAVLKTCIMNENRLRAVIAGTIGYESRMDEAERMKKFKEASELIEKVCEGEETHPMQAFIMASNHPIHEMRKIQKELEKQMEAYAVRLPVSEWVNHPNQTGFGLVSLAKVVGECGNLSTYTNPGKVWRRMGCAPHYFEGPDVKYNPHKMGSTWRFGKEGKLPAAEWEEFGYSPRRRSIAYQISEVLIKLNKGPYRARYQYAKGAVYKTHPEWEWKVCVGCEGSTKGEDGTMCSVCGGSGKKCMRAHRHGMLLAVKLLLKNLWGEWNGWPPYDQPWLTKR